MTTAGADRWKNRTRLSRSIIDSIRKACGDDFIIGMSISYSDQTPYIMTLEELQEVIALHDAGGNLDYVSRGAGNYVDYDRLMATFPYGEKQGVPLAAALKQVVSHARVTAECHIRTPENADYTIASGDSDLVSIVRGQIADPHWVNKTRDNRHDDIRGCISCNQMCWGRRSRDYWISCLINPSAGREFEWGGDRFAPAAKPRRVLVVGGGPAGLGRARAAAERGHQVTLAEASGELGGQFRLAGLAPRRGQITELIGWYLRQFEQLGVEVRIFRRWTKPISPSSAPTKSCSPPVHCPTGSRASAGCPMPRRCRASKTAMFTPARGFPRAGRTRQKGHRHRRGRQLARHRYCLAPRR